MAFKGRYTRHTAVRQAWIGGQFLPGRAPTNIGLYPQEYSQRLMISKNNRSKIKNGKLMKHKGSIGGDFWVVRHYYNDSNNLGDIIRFTPNQYLHSIATPHYETPQFAAFDDFNDADFPIVTPSDPTYLKGIATKAIAKMAPTKPEADLGSFLGELREGLPHAIGIRDSSKQRIARARNAGDEYLNVEFGWKPLVRDLQKFADVYSRSERILREYHKNSGVVTRKEHHEPEEMSVTVTDMGFRNPLPILSTANYGSSAAGRLTRTTTTKKKIWVVATFLYTVPGLEDSLLERKRSDINKLYGANFTPNMAWNMTPWTWAADWIGNGGDIAANMTYFKTDGLVMPYCYVMETKSVKVEYELRGTRNMYKSYPDREPYFYQSFETVSKYRIAGSPYGFALNWEGFTPKQLAILAALGISKSK